MVEYFPQLIFSKWSQNVARQDPEQPSPVAKGETREGETRNRDALFLNGTAVVPILRHGHI